MKHYLQLLSLGLLLPLVSSCSGWSGPRCEESYCVYEPNCPTPSCYYEPCCPTQCSVPYEECPQQNRDNRQNCEADYWNEASLRNY